MLKAVLVGFLLGFALIAGLRLAGSDPGGAQLTAARALHRGAAVDHVAAVPSAPDRRPVLLLT